jgi:hypothetical protein
VESLGARFDNKLVAEIGDRHLLLMAVTPADRKVRWGCKAAAVATGRRSITRIGRTAERRERVLHAETGLIPQIWRSCSHLLMG